MNPQINAKEITQNILIVLAIQNTILAHIRSTIYKSVKMSIPWIWLVRFYRLCYRPFVALLKNLILPYVPSSIPEKRTRSFRFPLVLYSSPTWVINIHPNTHKLWHYEFRPQKKLLGPTAQWETDDLQSGGVNVS